MFAIPKLISTDVSRFSWSVSMYALAVASWSKNTSSLTPFYPMFTHTMTETRVFLCSGVRHEGRYHSLTYSWSLHDDHCWTDYPCCRQRTASRLGLWSPTIQGKVLVLQCTLVPLFVTLASGFGLWMSKAWGSFQIRKVAGFAYTGNAGNLFPATAG